MQCLQCGKFFVEHDIYERYCSIECFTKAQIETLKLSPVSHFKIYYNGEEVKRLDYPEVKHAD